MTHYDVLGLAPKATAADIKRAYWHLARKFHPDKREGDKVKMQRLSEAYAVLSDKAKREQYDTSMGLAKLPNFGELPELASEAFGEPLTDNKGDIHA